MAMSSEPCIEEAQLGIKVRGDLGDVQIVEEVSESDEDDCCDTSKTSNALSTLQQDVFKPSMVPVYGTVKVTKSENVHFGNNTYFNGPVTIKQVIKSKEHDNPGYEHTEDVSENGSTASPRKPDSNVAKDPEIKPLQLQLWLKLTFSAVCIVLVGGLCAVVSIALLYSGQDDSSSSNHNEDDSRNCVKVEGIFYSYQNIKLILILISMILLTYIVWCYVLLTKDAYSGDKQAISVNVKQNSTRKDHAMYNAEADPLLIAPTHLRIVPRTDWLAQPVEKPLDKIKLPVPWVIITHTATEACHSQSECVLKVRLIQMFHVESRGWYDIGYNFLVAGDGSAYVGRGWDYQGAHTLGYNKYSMGIAFIGTFNNDPPPKKQLDACKKLIQKGVELGKITKDYKLFAHRQLASTLSPGDKLYDILKEWPHFVKNFTNIEDLLPHY